MQTLQDYFTHITSWHRTLLLAGGLVFFWICEGLFPLFSLSYRKGRHAALNLLFTLTTVIINFAFAFLIVRTSQYCTQHPMGLLPWLHAGPVVTLILGLLWLDLVSAWTIHWILHQIPWMWKFHLIHHSDQWVDVTSANRHHPGESVFRAAFTAVAVGTAGAPMWIVYLYQALSVSFSQFNHANIALPPWLDQALSWIIVSPNMHKVHHHRSRPLTDRNYGNIFSCWDRIFGTYTQVKDPSTLRYGIDSHLEENITNHAGPLMRLPFEPWSADTELRHSKRTEEPSS